MNPSRPSPPPKDQQPHLGEGSSLTGDITSAGVNPHSPPGLEFLAPPQQPDEIGRLGPYRILGTLGAGGMGMVFRAEDPTLRRAIALKVMLPNVAANPVAKSRFIREARSQAKVEHDNVIPIYLVSEDRGVPFLAMPLLKGQTLQAALKQNARPPVPEVLRIGREMAEGLAAAHELHLVHRDIKPANVWLEGQKRRVKILDFGLARVESDADVTGDSEHVTRDGAVVGTPAYMSPEQARGDDVDARTDLFSLGIVMYQMATGELPFKGSNAMAILMSLGIDTPEHPCRKNPAIPPALGDLIMQLLAKPAAERPASALAVAERIEQIEKGTLPQIVVQAAMPVANDPWADIDATDVSVSVPTSRRGRQGEGETRRQGDEDTTAKSKLPLIIGGGLAALLLLGVGGYFAFRSPKPKTVVPPAVVEPRPTPKATPKLSKDAAARKFAEFVLNSGEGFALRTDVQSTVYLTTAKDLPSSFRFHEIKFGDATFPDGSDVAAVMAPLGAEQWDETYSALSVSPRLNDAGLGRLTKLPFFSGAAIVSLSGSQITDAGLAHLRGLMKMKHLDVRVTSVDGSGFAHFKGSQSLVGLGAAGCPLKPENLFHLADFPIQQLAINDIPSLDDRAVEPLSRLKSLIDLDIHRTAITAEGVQRLAAALPSCRLRSDHGIIEPKSPAPTTPEASGPTEADRALLQFVLKTGGKVKIEVGKQQISTVTKPEEFPAKFKYNEITLGSDFDPNAADAAQAFAPIATNSWDDRCALMINRGPLDDRGLARLAALPFVAAVKRLEMTFAPISDDGLAALRGFSRLQFLDVGQCKDITGAGFVHLKSLPALTALRAARCPLTAASLDSLVDLPLHTLKIDQIPGLGDECVPALSRITSLRHLDLKATGVTAKGAKRLSDALPACHVATNHGVFEGKPSLDVAKPMIDRIVKAGGRFKLVVADKQGDWWDGTSPLPKDGQIGEILLPSDTVYKDKTRQGEEVAEWFAGMPASAVSTRFSSLTMGHCTPEGWRAIVNTPGLRFLRNVQLLNTPRDDAMPELARLPKLEVLSLAGGSFGDAGMKALATFPALRRVHFAISRITAAGLSEITALPLESLYITNSSGITDDAVEPLSRMRTLKYLKIEKTGMTAEGVKKLAAALPQCRIDSDHGIFEPRVVPVANAGAVDPSFFNGKDLTGWQGELKAWRVENGELRGRFLEVGTPRDIFPDRKFSDFEFSFQMRTSAPEANKFPTRISLRNEDPSKLGSRRCVLIQFHPTVGLSVVQVADGQTLTLNQTRRHPIPENQFFNVTVRCVGKQLKVTINGEVAFDREVDLLPTGYISWNTGFIPEVSIRDIRFLDLSKPQGQRAADPSFFNGKDLTGWEADPKHWSVRNGSIVGEAPAGTAGTRFLRSLKTHGDFDLAFRATITGTGNGGLVVFRGKTVGSFVDGPSVTASLGQGEVSVSRGPKSTALPFKAGDEVAVQIRCSGPKLTISVNGTTLCDGNLTGPPDGLLGFGVQPGCKMTLSDIRFTDLSQPAGDASFFNGKDLTGWNVTRSGGGDTKDFWKVENGELVGSKPEGGYAFLNYDKPIRDFELSFEARTLGHNANGTGYSSFRFRGTEIVGPNKAQVGVELSPLPARLIHLESGNKLSIIASKPNIELGSPNTREFHKFFVRVQGDRFLVKFDDRVAVDQEIPGLSKGDIFTWQLDPSTAELRIRNIQFKDLSQPGAIAPLGKPFLHVRNGIGVSAYATLAEVVAVARDTDVIEIRSAGPFAITSKIDVYSHLTLRAAPGVRPLFTRTADMKEQWFDVVKGSLSLEGIDILDGGSAQILWSHQQPVALGLTRCRAFKISTGAFIGYRGKLSITDSVLASKGKGAMISLSDSATPAGPCDLELMNSALITGFESTAAGYPSGQTLSFNRATIAGKFLYSHPIPDGMEPKPTRVLASNSLFIGPLGQVPELPFRTDWTGSASNVYPQGPVVIFRGGNLSMEAWKQAGGQPGPNARTRTEQIPIFEWPADETPGSLFPAVHRYLEEIRKTYPNAGADPAIAK